MLAEHWGAWTKRWIKERIVPSSRQNLGEVLRANNLEFYDEMTLFIAGDGKCEQDDFFIREIKSANDGINQSTVQQIGRAIKAVRTDAGMTQYQLAQAAKITQPALSNLENGHGNPTVNLLDDIASALGKTIDVRIIWEQKELAYYEKQGGSGHALQSVGSGYLPPHQVDTGKMATGKAYALHKGMTHLGWRVSTGNYEEITEIPRDVKN